LLIEPRVEQHNFAGHPFTAQRLQFVKIVHHDNFSRDSLRRRRDTSAERRQHNFLRGIRGHAWELGELSSFLPAHPVRDHYFFQRHFEAQLAQFGGHVINGCLGLR
jgi:hypothetical protein